MAGRESRSQVENTVDVLIVGAGASGAAIAWSLAETRMRILCLDQGGWVNPAEYPTTREDWESRAISDFHYCTYLSDLAVDVEFQRQGIGQELIRETHRAAGLATNLILLSAPKARSFYPHIGMTRHESCWTSSAGAEHQRSFGDPGGK